jgi:NADP-dependent 3-hydroxy acid dehydrogenase YdfG
VVAALVGAGMRVATCARRIEAMDALRSEMGHAAGDRLLTIPADLRREADILAMFERVRGQWGGVDVLVNNAGLGHKAPLASGATEHWREMLEVNVLALCVCTREAVSDMRRRGVDGHVIHVSSMAAHRVPSESGVYSASKYAVRALTEGLRQELRELGSGIRVTSVSPGFVETEFAARYHKSEDAARSAYGRYPVLQPEDVSNAVLYALTQPAHVQIHDILMRPTAQAS